MDVMLLRLCRLARLLRLIKLARTMQGFDALFLMMTTLKASTSLLFWTLILLLVCLTMFAFILNQTLVVYFIENDEINLEKRKRAFQYFGTFSRSIFSMFELTLGNYVVIARHLMEDISEWSVIFSIIYKLTFGFSVIAVINGSFIQETFKVAASDDRIMVVQKERAMKLHSKKMMAFFAAADSEGDGFISKEEFRGIVAEKKVQTWLAAQDLDATDADNLFVLMDDMNSDDGPGDGDLTTEELIHGVAKLKGPARSLDLAYAMHKNDAKHQLLMDKMLEMFEFQKNSTQVSGAGLLLGRGCQSAIAEPGAMKQASPGGLEGRPCGISPDGYSWGQQVEFRDAGTEWQLGVVTNLAPLMVKREGSRSPRKASLVRAVPLSRSGPGQHVVTGSHAKLAGLDAGFPKVALESERSDGGGFLEQPAETFEVTSIHDISLEEESLEEPALFLRQDTNNSREVRDLRRPDGQVGRAVLL